jgi:hypothetical protein
LDSTTSAFIGDAIRSGTIELDPSAAGRGRHAPVVSKLFERLPTFEKASVSELLDIRRELETPLVRFRAGIIKMSSELRHAPWERGFEHEVNELINRDIEPAMRDLEEASAANPYLQRLLLALTGRSTLFSGSAVGLAVSQVASLPVVSASAVAGGIVGAWAEAHKEWLDQQQQLKGNQLYFYYQVRKRFGGRRS